MSRCLPNASCGPEKYTRIPYHNSYPLVFHPGYVSCGIMDSERSIGCRFRFSIIDVAMFFTATWGYIAAETGLMAMCRTMYGFAMLHAGWRTYVRPPPPPPPLSDALGEPKREALEEAYSRNLQVVWLYVVVGTLSFQRRRAIAQKWFTMSRGGVW